MKVFNSFIVLVLVSLLFICDAKAENKLLEGFNEGDYEVFIPSKVKAKKKYPVIIGFSPNGRGVEVIYNWQEAAEKYNCIIIASNLVHNGKDVQRDLYKIDHDLHNELSRRYPINLKKVIAVGSSGGGMAAHLFSFFYPDSIAAVISNIGYIHERSIAQSNLYPRNKVCVLMTGTTDYNNKLLKEDYNYLINHGWKCKLIEFIGGHVMAPKECRIEALSFVLDNLKKKRKK